MMRRILPLCLLTALILAGCVPAPITYFRPAAAGAQYEQSSCGGHAGPADTAVMRGPNGILLSVRATSRPGRSLTGSGTGFALALRIPGNLDSPVRLHSGVFRLTDEIAGRNYEYRAEHLLDFPEIRVPLDGLFVGLHTRTAVHRIDIHESLPAISSREKFNDNTTRPYYILLEFPEADSDSLLLQIPPLQIDSAAYQFPPVRFQRVTETIVVPLNC